MQKTQEMQVQSLNPEDPLEEGMATHFSGLAWRIPMDRGAWWATFHGLKESDMTERLSTGLFFKKSIYLAVLSLSSCTLGLHCDMQHVGCINSSLG